MRSVLIMVTSKIDDLTKKAGDPSDFFILTITKFADDGQSLQKWEMDIHHETFKKITGTTEPKWKTVKKTPDGWKPE